MEKYRYYKYEIFSCTDNDAQVQTCGSALSQTSTPKWKEDRRRGGKEQKLCECGTSELCSSALSNLQRDQPTDEEEEDESTVIFYYFSFEVTIVECLSALLDSEAIDVTRRCKDVLFDWTPGRLNPLPPACWGRLFCAPVRLGPLCPRGASTLISQHGLSGDANVTPCSQTFIMWRFHTRNLLHTHTLTDSHRHTHTLCWHAARLCRGRSGGRTGHPARLAAQLRPWLGSPPPSACTHGVGRSHSPPNLHTHTEWCTAAVFNPPPGCRLHTYMLDGRWGVEDVGGGGGGGVGATPANTHTDTHRPDVSWLWKVEADHSLWLSTNWAPASRLELRHAAPSTPPPAS